MNPTKIVLMAIAVLIGCIALFVIDITKELESDYVFIYPNPSNGKFNLEIDSPENKKIEIFTLLGEKIYSKEIENSKMELNISKHKGVLLYKIVDRKTNNTLFQDKLIVE